MKSFLDYYQYLLEARRSDNPHKPSLFDREKMLDDLGIPGPEPEPEPEPALPHHVIAQSAKVRNKLKQAQDIFNRRQQEVVPDDNEDDFDPKHPDFDKQRKIANKQNDEIPHEHTREISQEEEAERGHKKWVFDKWDDLWMRQVQHELEKKGKKLNPTTMLGLRYYCAFKKGEDGNWKYPETIAELKLPQERKGKPATEDKDFVLHNLHLHRRQLLKKMQDLNYTSGDLSKRFSHLPPGEAGHKNLQRVMKGIFGDSLQKSIWDFKNHTLESEKHEGLHRQKRVAKKDDAWQNKEWAKGVEDKIWQKVAHLVDMSEKFHDGQLKHLPTSYTFLNQRRLDGEELSEIVEEVRNKLRERTGVQNTEGKTIVDDEAFLDKEVARMVSSAAQKFIQHAERRSGIGPKDKVATFGGLGTQNADTSSPGEIAATHQAVKDFDREESPGYTRSHLPEVPDETKAAYDRELPRHDRATILRQAELAEKDREERERQARLEREREKLLIPHHHNDKEHDKRIRGDFGVTQIPRPVLRRRGGDLSRLEKMKQKLAAKGVSTSAHAEPGYVGENRYSFAAWVAKKLEEMGGASGPWIAGTNPGEGIPQGAPQSMINPRTNKPVGRKALGKGR